MITASAVQGTSVHLGFCGLECTVLYGLETFAHCVETPLQTSAVMANVHSILLYHDIVDFTCCCQVTKHLD